MPMIIKNNWIRIGLVGGTAIILLYVFGCESTTRSLEDPQTKVTRAELQNELETILAKYELRNIELTRQDRIRDIITQNALIIAETGGANPIGIITTLLAVYGVGSATRDTKNAIKAKTKKSI